MYVSINKQPIGFQNCFSVLSRLRQGKVKRHYSFPSNSRQPYTQSRATGCPRVRDWAAMIYSLVNVCGVTDCSATDCGVTGCGATNCGVTDCSATDCGVTDCGATDCGLTDSSATDCGVTDCSATDCGVIDCSATDCGVTVARPTVV